jgi:hypothetical protein
VIINTGVFPVNNAVSKFFIKNPENFFAEDNLSYKRREVEDMIARFELAADVRPVHKEVIALLSELKNFRGKTDVDGIFEEMRQLGKSDEQLQQILSDLEQAVLNTQHFIKQALSVQDKKIILDALSYTKISVHQRMAELKPTDRLLPLWQQSLLQKMLI